MNRWAELSIDNFGSGKVGKNNCGAAGKLPNRPPIQFLALPFTIGPFKKHLEPAGGTKMCTSKLSDCRGRRLGEKASPRLDKLNIQLGKHFTMQADTRFKL